MVTGLSFTKQKPWGPYWCSDDRNGLTTGGTRPRGRGRTLKRARGSFGRCWWISLWLGEWNPGFWLVMLVMCNEENPKIQQNCGIIGCFTSWSHGEDAKLVKLHSIGLENPVGMGSDHQPLRCLSAFCCGQCLFLSKGRARIPWLDPCWLRKSHGEVPKLS